ncbi:type IV pilus biogenesis protein PilM [Bacillus kwashiorkori]|uniref:type IV pilus biogenesis protein PilM n=1 Tax=Bacillus kwashiorkori TaxID=1522318 RepID=UPI000784295D|nr:pilus assembly protein PilM [Bacillus kwashiorkori]
MLNILTTKKTINLVIDDYALRMVDHSGGDLTHVKTLKEKAIPHGLLEHGRIIQEMEFYHFIRDVVDQWGIKRRAVRFYVPDSLVIMKKVTFPAYLKDNEIIGHFNMELGQTLYLPFDNPSFDVYPLPMEAEGSERDGLLFAVPQEEIKKFTDIFVDASLKPIVADIRSLGVYRYYHYLMKPEETEAILFFELNLSSVIVSIFSNNRPEFLRYHDLDIQVKDWRGIENKDRLTWEYDGNEAQFLGLIDDQMVELERILNFYRYSIHKGSQTVSKIVILGDFPQLTIINDKIQQQFSLPIMQLDAYLSPTKHEKVERCFIPALGLALKGGK